MNKVRRLLAMVWLGCALVLWSAQAQAQLKSPAEIEAEIIARQRAAARPAPSDTSTPAEPTPAVPTPAVPTPAVPTPAVPTPAVPTPAVGPFAVPAPSADQDAQIEPALEARYHEIDHELAELDAHPAPGLRLPILGMVAGYAGSLVLAGVAIANADGEGSLSDPQSGLVLGLGAVAVFGVGIASHVWLHSRIKQRAERPERLRRLRLEQATLTGSTTSRLQARASLARLDIIDSELTSARRDHGRYGLVGPIVLISAGFTLFVPMVVVGIIASALGGPALPFVVAAAISGGAGFSGLAWLNRRRQARRPIGARIRELEGEKRSVPPISLDLQLRPDHASFSLQARF